MHNTMIVTTGMDQEPDPAHDSSPYGPNTGWVDVHAYSQSGTVSEMGGFGYMPAGLPSDSLSRIAPSPATVHSQSQQPQPQSTSPQPSHQSHHPQLPMLIMPSHTWPSMLTNPHGSYQTAPMSPPAVAQAARPKAHRNSGASTPRRTLTDDDRRQMCLYVEENPTAKQAEVGQMFGVERSTVSKVLARREKYLNMEGRSASPVRRSKGKLHDIDTAVAKWASKQEKDGFEVSDEELLSKAQHFALGIAGTELVQSLGDPWLQRYKRKNRNGQRKLTRRASETNIQANANLSTRSPLLAHPQQSSGISSASPTVQPSPLSGTRSPDELNESMSGLYSFRTEAFRRGSHPSSTSLSSAFTETATSAVSPIGPFPFSPDSNVGGGFLSDQRHLPAGPESSFQRPRSQTFPNLDIECLNQQGGNSDQETPKYPVSSTAPSSALESPSRELDARHFAMGSVISSPPQLHHSNSNGSLVGSLKGTRLANTTTPISASPVSPTLEDARRGLDLALNYVQRSSSRYNENDLTTVIRFFEGFGLGQFTKAPGSSMHTVSGLSRIPEGGEEMGNPPAATVKLESMVT